MAYHNPNNNFYRSKDGAVLGGVCSGLSESLKIDVIIIRILFLGLLILDSIGFWLYIALWILLPLDSNQY